MTTISRLAAISTDRFVATDNGNFWFVADTHATDANGTARVKDKKDVKRWAEGVVAAEIEWDSIYVKKEGATRDGEYKLVRLDSGKYEISTPKYPSYKPVLVDNEWTAALYIRERKLWWVSQTTNLGVGSKVAMRDPKTGVYRTEVVTQYIAWADNSDEIVGHLGGRRMLSAPSGDACF